MRWGAATQVIYVWEAGRLQPAAAFWFRIAGSLSVIVSASYRTDIPAFYAEWLMRRLRAGYCRVANPYGGGTYEVALTPEVVDGFVFWTRNMRPLMADLDEIRRVAPFVAQFTLTGYPRALESSVIAVPEAVAQLRELRRRFGPRAAVWRRRNLDRAGRRHGFAWHDPPPDEKQALLARLAGIAAEHGLAPTLCSQPELLVPGLGEAHCIDAERLSEVAQQPIAARENGNRPGCRCAQSRDIGAYDSCPHGCVYCYAVADRDRAVASFRVHDPEADCLMPPARRPAHTVAGTAAASRS